MVTQSGPKTNSLATAGIILLGSLLCPVLLATENNSAKLEDPVAAAEAGFAGCLPGLRQQAADAGLQQATVALVDNLQFQAKVIEYDRRQPEFTTPFSDYYRRRVSDQRIAQGRRQLQNQQALLQRLNRQYGIPPQYLLAFWGLETNYGSYLGKMPTLDSLATLACDPRRSQFFTRQLLDALKILQQEELSRDQMQGSWAGAIGHTQFMPSVYLQYAVDGDNDGRIDLWRSESDALTSAAAFLQGLGWHPSERWGREVLLPESFDFQLLGKQQSLSVWQQVGLRRSDGGPLPIADMQARLLLPSGEQGPAFLVYRNFDVIMGWNRSEYYALAVGRLADRINGAGRLQRELPEEETRFSREQMQQLQQSLLDAGFDPGSVDGILGPATRQAIQRYQRAQGVIADGYPDRELVQQLQR